MAARFLCIMEYVPSSEKVVHKAIRFSGSMNLKIKCYQIASFESEEESEKHIEKIGEEFTM